MGLPWPEWGETDVALTGALHHMDAMTCQCCGHPIDIAHNEDYARRWQVEVATCYPGAALGEFRKKHAESLEPGQMTYVRLLGPDEEPRDPLTFDPERAAKEYARHMESLGLTD